LATVGPAAANEHFDSLIRGSAAVAKVVGQISTLYGAVNEMNALIRGQEA
jgi:hypothetical protein